MKNTFQRPGRRLEPENHSPFQSFRSAKNDLRLAEPCQEQLYPAGEQDLRTRLRAWPTFLPTRTAKRSLTRLHDMSPGCLQAQACPQLSVRAIRRRSDCVLLGWKIRRLRRFSILRPRDRASRSYPAFQQSQSQVQNEE